METTCSTVSRPQLAVSRLQLARRLGAVGLLTACLAATALARAQQEEPKKPQATKKPELVLPGMESTQEDQQEMVRLFHEVERTLAAIDVELADAGAGRIPVPEGKDSGIERLLRAHGEKSDQAVSGIERILELAEKLGGQSGQCMKAAMNAPPQEGQSPLDKERGRGPTQGEKTPEAPKPDPEKGKGPEQPKPPGEKEDNRGKNPPPGENVPSPPRHDEAGPPVAPGDDAERWGALPERVREVFRNQITDDLPLQYRDWIDSYYRRLNSSR